MKLWPFSKKDETPSAAQPASPPSRKMDLPPGVMLADPSELDLQPGQTKPAGSESSRETVPPATRETEISQPQTPSFEDLAYIPSPEAAEPQDVSQAPEPAKSDLNGLFDQHQLEMVSQTIPTHPSTPEEPASLAPLPDVEPALQAFFSDIEPKTPDQGPAISPSASETGSNRLDFMTADLQPVPAEQLEQSPLDHLDFFNPIGFEDSPANDLFSDFMSPPPQETPATPQNVAPTNNFNEIPTQAAFPSQGETSAIQLNRTETEAQSTETFGTTHTQPAEQEQGSFFLHPAGSELYFQQTDCMFGIFNEVESPVLTEHTLSEITEDAQSTNFQFTTEDAFLPEAPLELPPQLNLPDEALMPNANDNFFQTTAIPPALEETYPVEEFENDSFDLDSLLLGHQPEEQEANPLEAMEFEPQAANQIETVPSLSYATDFLSETLDEGPGHYFGDEAEGLKGGDNTESYDFGHYEDPDEPVAAFVLDNDEDEPVYTFETDPPVTFTECIIYGDDNVGPEADFSFGETEQEVAALFQPEALSEMENDRPHPADEAPSYVNMPSLPSQNEFMQSLQHPVTPGYQAPTEPVESEEAATPEVSEPPLTTEDAEPSIVQTKEKPIPAMAIKPAAEKRPPLKPLVQPKPYRESLADRIGSFEQEVLLKNSQFLSQSIDHLVNSYFEQQDQEAS